MPGLRLHLPDYRRPLQNSVMTEESNPPIPAQSPDVLALYARPSFVLMVAPGSPRMTREAAEFLMEARLADAPPQSDCKFLLGAVR